MKKSTDIGFYRYSMNVVFTLFLSFLFMLVSLFGLICIIFAKSDGISWALFLGFGFLSIISFFVYRYQKDNT